MSIQVHRAYVAACSLTVICSATSSSADDAEVMSLHARMNGLGSRALSQSGSWTQFNPTTRALYTRDRDGFFIEVLERR